MLLFLLVLLTGCGKSMSHQGDGVGDITGAWVRSLSEDMGVAGLYLHQNGSLRLINIFSMQGDSWSLEGDRLTLFTHTERYPQPEPDVYTVRILSDKKMVLARQEAEIEYRRPVSGKDLLATRWLASYVPGPPAEAEPEQEVSFNLQSDGRIEGFAGCNKFSGSYIVSKETVRIGSFQSTNMFCPAMKVEDNLFRALEETEEFLIVEDQLCLYKGNMLQGFFKAQQNQ